MKTHHLQTLTQLFSLKHGEMLKIVESEAIPMFDFKTGYTIGYIPTLEARFHIDEEAFNTIKNNINQDWFSIEEGSDGIITITSSEINITPTVLLASDIWEDRMPANYNPDTYSILFPTDEKDPIFIGETPYIMRLSRDFPNGSKTYTVKSYHERINN